MIVFIGGSRRIGRLNEAVRGRIQNIIAEDLEICVGDANGADKAVQNYLAEQGYRRVVVFCTGSDCRNNIGGWESQQVHSDRRTRDFLFFAAKDVAMSEKADYGLMLWEGTSIGTLHNILNLANRGKQTVVYFAPEKDFITIRSLEDVGRVVTKCAPEDIRKFERRLGLSNRIRQSQPELPLTM